MTHTSPTFAVDLEDPQFYVDEVECLRGCPVKTDARGYIISVSRRDYLEGYRYARGPNPFASICGRVCGAPCEVECRRGKVDRTVTIRALKGFTTERHGVEAVPVEETLRWSDVKGRPDATPSGKKVAMVGGGVASFTCAHDLARLGHECHIFDKCPEPGGMLTYGVPVYRLDRELVKREIAAILSMDLVHLHPNTWVGKPRTDPKPLFGVPHAPETVDFEDLCRDYDAVFVGIGLWNAKRLRLPGSDHPDVLAAIEIIYDYNSQRPLDLTGRHVLTIGGGDVAFDSSRTVLRMGAAHSSMVCLERNWEEMPAAPNEIEEGHEEGVEICPGWGPREILVEDGKITGVRCVKVRRVFDEQGRFSPTFEEGKERVLPCDMVIFSVGQGTESPFLESIPGLEHDRGIIKADPVTKQTNLEGVFAGGDVALGPKLFITCIQDGSLAALAIHAYMTGENLERKRRIPTHRPLPNYWRQTDYLNVRHQMPRLAESERRARSHELVELPFSEEEAEWQALRCLECHVNPIFNGNLCIMCNGCVDVCPYDCLRMVDAASMAGDDVRAVVREEMGGRDPFPGECSAMLFDRTACIRCGLCALRCPTDAVIMEEATFRIEYVDTGRKVAWSSS